MTDQRRTKSQALCLAILAEDVEKVKKLLQEGSIDLTHQFEDEPRPKYCRERHSWEEGDESEIESAMPLFKEFWVEREGQSPLSLAATVGRPAIIRALLEVGADVNRPVKIQFFTYRRYDMYPIEAAAGAGRRFREGQISQDDLLQSYQALLEAGASLSLPRRDPLVTAVTANSALLVRFLVKAGADPAGRQTDPDYATRAFDVAVQTNSPGSVQALLELSNDPVALMHDALNEAVRHINVLRLFLDTGADPNFVRRPGATTPLESAWEAKALDSFKLLLERGVQLGTSLTTARHRISLTDVLFLKNHKDYLLPILERDPQLDPPTLFELGLNQDLNRLLRWGLKPHLKLWCPCAGAPGKTLADFKPDVAEREGIELDWDRVFSFLCTLESLPNCCDVWGELLSSEAMVNHLRLPSLRNLARRAVRDRVPVATLMRDDWTKQLPLSSVLRSFVALGDFPDDLELIKPSNLARLLFQSGDDDDSRISSDSDSP